MLRHHPYIYIRIIFSEIPYNVAEMTVSRLSNALALVTSPQVTLTWASLGKSWAQFSSVQSCPTLWDPMNCSMPGFPIHHQLLEFTQTHVHRVGDAIRPSHPLSSPSPSPPNPFQHHGLFQWVNSSHEVAKELEFQPQHQLSLCQKAISLTTAFFGIFP